jgi:amino acid transporter
VSGVIDATKRVLLGRAMSSARLGETFLPKRIALPVFASDALSSVAYAPDEIFLTLSLGGMAAYVYSWQIGIAVVIVMLTVVASYRQNVHAYPSGGGDYEVATVNLGRRAGLVVASALLVDYTLTVAVSVSSGVQNASAAVPFLRGHEAQAAVVLVLLLMAVNLRGVRESGAAFAIPTYAFMIGIIGMALFGFYQAAFGHLQPAKSATLHLAAAPSFAGGFTGVAAIFLLMRAFSSGCAALTGVEAISNGVPAFRKPKSRNAATTLLMLGLISITMLMAIIQLARKTNLHYAEDPATQLIRPDGTPVGPGYTQDTVIAQLSHAVFHSFPMGFYWVLATTGIILVLAANTAFNGFPVLGSVLARDGFLPRQLHTRGDRLAYSNGIIILAGVAIVLIVAFNAQVTKLIQLYIVGVFISFTMSQTGMIKHWTRLLKTEKDPSTRKKMHRSRVINAFGLVMTGTVLIVVLLTKFVRGAWIAIIAMAVIYVVMVAINRHYSHVAEELKLESDETTALPSRVHSVVLVSKLHKPALRALAYARAGRPTTIEALTVRIDPDETDALVAEWERLGIPVPLTILDSPFREVTRPIVDYVREVRRQSPRDIVDVYIPEYVVGRWWEAILHNQSALRLKTRLRFTPGVVVVSVPYQLTSSLRVADRPESFGAGAVRRGEPRAQVADEIVSSEFEK